MRQEGNVSKVAYCEKCGAFALACHVDHISKDTEKDLAFFAKKGFLIKTETIAETKAREWGEWKKCSSGKCEDHNKSKPQP